MWKRLNSFIFFIFLLECILFCILYTSCFLSNLFWLSLHFHPSLRLSSFHILPLSLHYLSITLLLPFHYPSNHPSSVPSVWSTQCVLCNNGKWIIKKLYLGKRLFYTFLETKTLFPDFPVLILNLKIS